MMIMEMDMGGSLHGMHDTRTAGTMSDRKTRLNEYDTLNNLISLSPHEETQVGIMSWVYIQFGYNERKGISKKGKK